MDTCQPRLRVGHMTAEEMSRTSRALLWASLSEGIVVWFQYVKEGTWLAARHVAELSAGLSSISRSTAQ